MPLKCPSSGFMCPGAAHDAAHKGSLPIEVAQGRRIELRNATSYRCNLLLQLALSSEDFPAQQNELEQRLTRLYGTPVSLDVQAAGSVVVTLTAANLNATALEEFEQRARGLTDSRYSASLHVDTTVLSAVSVEVETIRVPVDVIW